MVFLIMIFKDKLRKKKKSIVHVLVQTKTHQDLPEYYVSACFEVLSTCNQEKETCATFSLQKSSRMRLNIRRYTETEYSKVIGHFTLQDGLHRAFYNIISLKNC